MDGGLDSSILYERLIIKYFLNNIKNKKQVYIVPRMIYVPFFYIL